MEKTARDPKASHCEIKWAGKITTTKGERPSILEMYCAGACNQPTNQASMKRNLSPGSLILVSLSRPNEFGIHFSVFFVEEGE